MSVHKHVCKEIIAFVEIINAKEIPNDKFTTHKELGVVNMS